MQQPITSRDVYVPSVTATIGNDEVDVSSVDISRELPDPLSGGQLTAATGTIAATVGEDVTSRVPTPWDPASSWPPPPETTVDVSMDVGDGPVSVLAEGRVTEASGTSTDREVSVGYADRYQTLDRSISWNAVADAMPSLTEGTTARYVGMVTTAVTDMILRHCGWYSTPPQSPYCVLSVPAQGTMWPERGVCRIAQAQSTASAFPSFVTSPWGVCVADVDATYGPSTTYSIAERGAFDIVAMAGEPNGNPLVIQVSFGSHIFRLTWTDARISAYAPNSSGAQTVVTSVVRTTGLVKVRFERISATSVRATVTAGTQTQTGTLTVPAASLTTQLDQIRIYGTGAGGGFQLAFPTAADELAGWEPNAVIHARTTSRNSLRVLPAVATLNCATLLGEQCAAENATYWIDELGILQWWDMSRLDAQPTRGTLTSADHITESGFTWSHELSAVKSRALVKWREPLRAWSWYPNVVLHQGSGSTLSSSERTVEEWINTPDDEVWIMPDLTLSQAGYESSITDYNYGLGSFYGGIVGENEAWAWDMSASIERVNDTAFKLIQSWSGTGDVTMKGVSTREVDDRIWSARLGIDLPVIRGRAKFTFADRSTESTTMGPATSPEHEIDAGWWIQRDDQAAITAEYAAGRVTIPQPELSGVDLIPVPGLQIGDIVNVHDTHSTRLLVRGVVTADSRNISADASIDHSASIRPLSVSVDGIEWIEWGTVVRRRHWQSWAAQQAGNTWQDWGSEPLKGEQ